MWHSRTPRIPLASFPWVSSPPPAMPDPSRLFYYAVTSEGLKDKNGAVNDFIAKGAGTLRLPGLAS